MTKNRVVSPTSFCRAIRSEMVEASDGSSPDNLSKSCSRESRSPDRTTEKKDWWVMNRRAFDEFERERDIKNLHERERERERVCVCVCVLCWFYFSFLGLCFVFVF